MACQNIKTVIFHVTFDAIINIIMAIEYIDTYITKYAMFNSYHQYMIITYTLEATIANNFALDVIVICAIGKLVITIYCIHP